MKRKLVIVGTGGFAEVAQYVFERDSAYTVVAFTVNATHIKAGTFCEKPVVTFEEVEKLYPPEDHDMFVAVGYSQLNQLRARLFHEAKAKGYRLASYISSKATTWDTFRHGENCFVFEHNNIQPFATVGDNVILWSGNHIGHHSRIDDHCFLASHIVVSGYCHIGEKTFIGVNVTFRDAIRVGKRNLIGAGALIMKSTADDEVYIPQRTRADARKSHEIDF